MVPGISIGLHSSTQNFTQGWQTSASIEYKLEVIIQSLAVLLLSLDGGDVVMVYSD